MTQPWPGRRPGPCTTGEARTLTAVICGAEPEAVKAFIAIGFVKCDDPMCDEAHGMITNSDIKPAAAIRALAEVIASLTESLDDGS